MIISLVKTTKANFSAGSIRRKSIFKRKGYILK